MGPYKIQHVFRGISMNDEIWDIFQHGPNTVVYTFCAHRTRLVATGQIGINEVHPDTIDWAQTKLCGIQSHAALLQPLTQREAACGIQ